MLSRLRAFRDWIRKKPHADILAVGTLLAVSFLYFLLTRHKILFGDDQAWFMQVAARLTSGDVLYRDIWWAYPPLPVYLLSLLYVFFGINLNVAIFFGQILATLACVLSYRIARFLLPAPLALFGTLAVFLGGLEWRIGGFLSYITTYTLGVSLGAVLGLLFVIFFINYVKSEKRGYLLGSGILSGGCFLVKPEYALATFGTATIFLLLFIVKPRVFSTASSILRNSKLNFFPLCMFLVSTFLVVGIGYGCLIYKSGWHNVWSGISGYGQAKWLLFLLPPWGDVYTWIANFSGLGLNVLFAVFVIIALFSRITQKQFFLFLALMLLCVGVVFLGQVLLVFTKYGWSFVLLKSKHYLLRQFIAKSWTAGTILLTILIAAIAIRWHRAINNRLSIDKTEQIYAVLAVFSALTALRNYFSFSYALSAKHLSTLVPVLVFFLVVRLPQKIENWTAMSLNYSRSRKFLAFVLLTIALAGFTLDYKWIKQFDHELSTPRGHGYAYPFVENQAVMGALGYILTQTKPTDWVAMLGSGPKISFLSGRKTPLKQDYFCDLNFSSSDVADIAKRVEIFRPKLIVALCSIGQRHFSANGELKVNYNDFLNWGPNFTPIWINVNKWYEIATEFSISPATHGGSWDSFVIFSLREKSAFN